MLAMRLKSYHDKDNFIMKKMITMSQPKLNSYFGFKDIIMEMAEGRLSNVGSIDNATAMPSKDLSASNTLSHNVPLRNTEQKSLVLYKIPAIV